jgi:hypothetical protein
MRNSFIQGLALLACIGLVRAVIIHSESGPSKYGVQLTPQLGYQELM